MTVSFPRLPARAYFLRGLIVVVLAFVLSGILHRLGLIGHLELVNFDIWLLSKQKSTVNDLVLVTIGQEDYEQKFGARSPLDTQKVIGLINDIAKAEPQIIGVDLDTSSWKDDDLTKISTAVPIVWADEAIVQNLELGSGRDGLPLRGQHVEKTIPINVAGQPMTDQCWGLTAIAPDDDGKIRKYYTKIPVFPGNQSQSSQAYPSFVAVIGQYVPLANPTARLNCGLEGKPTPGADDDALHFINYFTGDISRYAARAVSKLPPDELKGKIVLLGGTFRQARDSYPTPKGPMDGVEILGHAVLTEKHGGIREASSVVTALIDVFVGLLLITINYVVTVRLPASARFWALPIEFVLLPVFSALLSLAAFLCFRYYSSFFVVLLGVFTHQLVEHVLEYRALLAEHSQLAP